MHVPKEGARAFLRHQRVDLRQAGTGSNGEASRPSAPTQRALAGHNSNAERSTRFNKQSATPSVGKTGRVYYLVSPL